MTIYWSIRPKFGGNEKKSWDKLTKIWSIRPTFLGRIVLSWDELTKVGRIDLKLERTDQNWDELVWDKLDLEGIDSYPKSSQFVPTQIRTNQFVPLFESVSPNFGKFVPTF